MDMEKRIANATARMQRIVETCNEETCDPMQAARHLEQIRNWAHLAMADLHGNGGDGPRARCGLRWSRRTGARKRRRCTRTVDPRACTYPDRPYGQQLGARGRTQVGLSPPRAHVLERPAVEGRGLWRF